MSVQWNEILSNEGEYKFEGRGGEMVGSKTYLLYWATVGPGIQEVDPNPLGGDEHRFDFVETNGGRLAIRGKATGNCILYDGQRFVESANDATHFLPDDVGGNVVLRFEHQQQLKYLGFATQSNSDGWHDLVASVDPADPNSQWQLGQLEGPAPHPNLTRWLHTYVPENRFSPKAFLEHMRIVVNGDDPVHNDPQYLSGLSNAEKASILTKIDAWESDFAAATALQRAEANGALLLTSAAFYNHPTSEFNDLDPKKPPTWSDVDDELGSDPFPG